MKEDINSGRRDFLKNVGLVAAATVGGFTGTPIVKRMFDKNQEQPQEQPKVLPSIPDKNDLIRETELVWISKNAREFLDTEKIKAMLTFDSETGYMKVEAVLGRLRGTITKDPVNKKKVKEILVDLSKDESTISFYYLDRVGNGGEFITLRRTGDELKYNSGDIR